MTIWPGEPDTWRLSDGLLVGLALLAAIGFVRWRWLLRGATRSGPQ